MSCSDRLLKGLTKLPEIPVYAISLELPHGMCVDTGFSVPHLMAAMEQPGGAPGAAAIWKRLVPLRREGIA